MSFFKKLFRFIYRSRVQKYSAFPGPPPSFPLGNIGDFLGKEPWETLSSYTVNYGEIFVFWLGGNPQICIQSPEYFEKVLESDWNNFFKDSPIKELTPVITKYTPFLANNPEWKQMRKLNPFSSDWFNRWLEAQDQPLLEATKLKILELGEKSNYGYLEGISEIQKLSFDLFSISVIGKYAPTEVYEHFCSLGKTGSKRLTSLIKFSFVLNPIFYFKRKKWLQYFQTLIKDYWDSPNPNAKDLTTFTILNGATLLDEAFVANTADVFYGGVYSVTSVLLTTLWFLSKEENNKYLEKLQKEIRLIISKTKSPDFKSIDQIEILEQVIREAMRIYPPVPFYSRNSSKQLVTFFNEHAVPPNTTIALSNYYLHRTPEFWKDPLEFKPERWTKKFREENPYGSSYFFPFGRGPRSCMGMPYALRYLKTVLFTIYSKGKIEF
ncbi:MAG: cytochrome P450, partial [Leptospiraceae bacterium]|nr:cytochrome P450 [Leptospiraceae bacterium]